MSHSPHSDLGLVNTTAGPSPLRELGGGVGIVIPSISCTLSALYPVSQSSQSQPGGQVALSTLTEKETENQRVTFLRSHGCKWQVRNLAIRFMNFPLYLKK